MMTVKHVVQKEYAILALLDLKRVRHDVLHAIRMNL